MRHVAVVVIDARGLTALRGLIDSHSHPTFGEFTPAQEAHAWITHYLHGGVTALISAGELHLPGLPVPPDPATALSLALLAKRCYDQLRPFGVKVYVGTLLLVPALEAYINLAAMALNTSRVTLGTGVTNPVTRHPAVTASALATLDEAAPGPVILGIGLGDSAVETMGMKPSRLAAFEKTVHRMRALLAGEEVAFEPVERRVEVMVD